jgi:L-alanine-DL-glutamate epimerase-like enolase superfamily enzyme
MQIVDIELHSVVVSRAYATQIAQEGGGERDLVAKSQFVFIEATTNTGLTGWGEISDLPPSEIPDLNQLGQELSRLLVGRDPFELQRLHADLREAWPFTADSEFPRLVSAGVDMLCYDLQAQSAAVPVYKLLGGKHRERVHVSWVAFIREDLELLCKEILEKTAAGFDAFKLKVGVDIDLDDERLAVLRETAGPEANIKIDPNGGWNLDEARINIPRLAKHNISGVETPIALRDPHELAALRKETDVALIEHVMSADDAIRYIRYESLDWFNIATTGCGGIWPARQIAEMAHAAGVGILLGSTVEMGPGTLAQLHLAASIRDLTLPSDLIGPAMYADDVLASPLQYEFGHLQVPKSPGLGGTIDRNKLDELASQ